MNNRFSKDGFTLVEILVAVAIIASILSMVYGSYFAISKSTQACKERITQSQQGRKTLKRMAQQIRCSYAGAAGKSKSPAQSGLRQNKMILENTINYFNGNPDAPSGEILHLVTTKGLFEWESPADGLFEIAYKFDKRTGVLFLSQERFAGTAQKVDKNRVWRPIAKNIECIKLAFFDGQQWLRDWNCKDKNKLPYAVKIEISCQGEIYQLYQYGTIAYVYCQNNQNKETLSKALVSVNK